MSASMIHLSPDHELKDVRHQIKNDISVIIAFSQLLRLNPQDPKAAEFLRKIEQRAQNILQTVDQYMRTTDR